MNVSRSHRRAAGPLALLVALSFVLAGCGRSGAAADNGTAPTPTGAIPVASGSSPASPTPGPTRTDATDAVPTPVPAPDLGAIDSLLMDINDDLDADAGAGADEGSTP